MKEYKNILLPVDFSESCAAAANRAKDISQRYGSKLTVLHVIDYIPPSYVSVEIPAKYSSVKLVTSKAREHLSDWASNLELQDCEQIVLSGQPKTQIVETANKMDIDLIILGQHDDAGIFKYFGSITNAVAQHVECDVLVVKSSAKAL